MDIYLNKEELLREENLFSPHEISYTPLTGKAIDIKKFTQKVGTGDETRKPPPSC